LCGTEHKFRVGATDHKSGEATGSEAMRIDSSGNVGIGTSSPQFPFTVNGDEKNSIAARDTNSNDYYIAIGPSSLDGAAYITAGSGPANNDVDMVFRTASNGTESEAMRIDSSGRVGIGTSSPSSALDVQGDIEVSGGVYLGGTGSANYLDDYEEGTWTPTSAEMGTLTIEKAQYTKIGRQVHLFAQFTSDSTTTVTIDNAVTISGLPFVPDSNSPRGIGGISQFYGAHGGDKNALADMVILGGELECEIIVVRGTFTYADCFNICLNVTYNTTG